FSPLPPVTPFLSPDATTSSTLPPSLPDDGGPYIARRPPRPQLELPDASASAIFGEAARSPIPMAELDRWRRRPALLLVRRCEQLRRRGVSSGSRCSDPADPPRDDLTSSPDRRPSHRGEKAARRCLGSEPPSVARSRLPPDLLRRSRRLARDIPAACDARWSSPLQRRGVAEIGGAEVSNGGGSQRLWIGRRWPGSRPAAEIRTSASGG
ncbi:unnamed protein product, partial [Urochloa humidicola]